MKRTITQQVTGHRTVDGAGVSLVRVLGHDTVQAFDPILMLDSFDSTNPDEYTAGFPLHPHRGIETISYVYKGKMKHKDTIGNTDTVSDGEVQWMNSGSGIMHAEEVPAADRLLGVQLWLNLPAAQKMSSPTYRALHVEDIPEVAIEGGRIRVLAGAYGEVEGHKSEHLPFTYYDIHLTKGAKIGLPTVHDDSIMLFTLKGEAIIDGVVVQEKTAVKLSEGDSILIEAAGDSSQVLFMASRALKEPVAWAGPIVMNTQEELAQASRELQDGTFIKEGMEY
ncbi:pirin family protein [Collinsella sp. AGMB00827]|uniref:Pirin family protein n=1 Tax=Collinsella ureilytica TaxID=2869515 RepID=A0ABS7MK43_9ACTN|nr:pirin family protein [Collinsella urealyticum]MBY4797741.1 pirin family protein [Collinsella urealyticum]